MPLTLTSNIDAVMARFTKLEAALPVAAHAALSAAAVTSEAIAVSSIEAHTPVGGEPLNAAGGGYTHLQDTTVGDWVVEGDTALVVVKQTKTIPIRGEMFPLAALLTSGHDAPATPILPVAKRALFWAGLPHPVGSSPGGAAAPDPYIAEATVEALPLIDAALVVAGKDALKAALAAS